jgi:hypothetical protein
MYDRTYAPGEIADALRKAGAPADAVRRWVAIALAESGGRAMATNESPVETSLGPWQINLKAHPGVSVECARDLACATAEAKRISKGFTDAGPWGAFTNGSYRKYLDRTPLSDDEREKISTKLAGLVGKIQGSLGGFSDKQAADELRAAFPDVPLEWLRSLAFTGGKDIPDASQVPVLGGIGKAIVDAAEGRPVTTLPNVPLAKDAGELIALLTTPSNMWRLLALVGGAVLIVAGVKLYTAPSPDPVRSFTGAAA